MKTRTLGILIAAGVVVVGGGVAFAFFTNVGAGTGAAGTGSNNPVVVKQTSTVTAMAPGVPPQQLSGNFDNTNNPGPVFIKSVTATVTSVTTVAPATPSSPAPPACTPADFGIGVGATAPVAVAVGQQPTGTTTAGLSVEIPAGAAQGAWSGLTLQFMDKATNQDACKGSTANITYTAQ